MGIPSVGSTSGEERDEDTDPGEVNLGVADDSLQRPDSSSGAVEGSRGIGRKRHNIRVKAARR